MCTGKCTMVIGAALVPMALLAIVANVLLFFPNAEVTHLEQGHLSDFTWYMAGIAGGGLLIIVPAMQLIGAGSRDGCCSNRCGMLTSVLLSLVGVAGALYCLVVSTVALVEGPMCLFKNGSSEQWDYPFGKIDKWDFQILDTSYLFNSSLWSVCKAPVWIVEWHISLFSIMMAVGAVEVALCLVQAVNGFVGVLCGTCRKEKPRESSSQAPLYSMDSLPRY
ncbi:transmembrane 4 L6 family member 1-like [Petromyzon marinus]|uniref:Transmembrane 4 L6 family member 1-like n=1 Tax=Petromyzon marinus TaxID=7757 RepID=A0AAJ7U6Z9_PETMA|nr:transmembrane 4 L6 family member 1-like [Petromyzon marinus]